MKIWIHINGVQMGPYSLEQIKVMNLPPATPVWYEGLPQWMPACQAPMLASLFASGETEQQTDEMAEPESVVVEIQENAEPSPEPRAKAVAAELPRRPSAYLVWSIIITFCCCSPVSVAAIVTGAITNTRYNRGDYDGARRMSYVTEWLVIIAMTLGIVGLPVSMLMYL